MSKNFAYYKIRVLIVSVRSLALEIQNSSGCIAIASADLLNLS